MLFLLIQKYIYRNGQDAIQYTCKVCVYVNFNMGKIIILPESNIITPTNSNAAITCINSWVSFFIILLYGVFFIKKIFRFIFDFSPVFYIKILFFFSLNSFFYHLSSYKSCEITLLDFVHHSLCIFIRLMKHMNTNNIINTKKSYKM